MNATHSLYNYSEHQLSNIQTIALLKHVVLHLYQLQKHRIKLSFCKIFINLHPKMRMIYIMRNKCKKQPLFKLLSSIKLFPKPPLLAYKRAKNMADTLVSSKLPRLETYVDESSRFPATPKLNKQ